MGVFSSLAGGPPGIAQSRADSGLNLRGPAGLIPRSGCMVATPAASSVSAGSLISLRDFAAQLLVLWSWRFSSLVFTVLFLRTEVFKVMISPQLS